MLSCRTVKFGPMLGLSKIKKWHVEVRVALLSQLCFELQMPASPSDSMMSESPQRLQIISSESTTTPQRIQVPVHGQHHLFLCIPVL